MAKTREFDNLHHIVPASAVHRQKNLQRLIKDFKDSNFEMEPLVDLASVAASSKNYYRKKITSSNTSCLEAHVSFLRLLMKGIFGPYAL